MPQLTYVDPYVAASANALDLYMKASASKPEIFGANGKVFALEDSTGNGLVDIGGGTYVHPAMLGIPMAGPTHAASADTGAAGASGFDSSQLVLPNLTDVWGNPLVQNTLDSITDEYGGAYGYFTIPSPTGDSQMINADYHSSYSDPWSNPDGNWSYYSTDVNASLEGLSSAGTTTMAGTGSFSTLNEWGTQYPQPDTSNWTQTLGTTSLSLEETPITFGYSTPGGSGDLASTVLHTATFSSSSSITSGSYPASGNAPTTNTDWQVTFSQLGGPTPDFATEAGGALAMLTNPYETQGGAMSDLSHLFSPQPNYYYGEKG